MNYKTSNSKSNHHHNNNYNTKTGEKNFSGSNKSVKEKKVLSKEITKNQEIEFRSTEIIVIGAGPAGLMAAVTASERGKKVIILESNSVAGKKLATTGNGKCNFTNTDQKIEYYRSNNSEKAYSIIQKFDFNKVIDFFDKIGIPCRERNGYCYPYSEQAKSFRDVFVQKVNSLSCDIVYECRVTDVIKDKNTGKFRVSCENGSVYTGDKVIVCCGGLSYKAFGCTGTGFDIAKSFGINVIKPACSLSALETDYDSMKWLDGVRVQVRISLECGYEEAGEIVFNKSGLSGIPVLNCSRYVVNSLKDKKKVSLTIDFARDFEYAKMEKYITDCLRRTNNPKEALKGIVNDKLLTVFEYNIEKGIAFDGSKLEKNASKSKAYTDYIKKFTLNITGTAEIDKAQVTQGGVSLDELSDELESVKIPGLFFAGENVDVDGKCGGYNLQWAFSSGYVAGLEAIK